MGSKKMITDSTLPDRISDLPSDIISFILDRLSFRDAVATSILSKDWRHKWRRIRNLIFDDEFVDDFITPRIQCDGVKYYDIIGSILLHHIGPIQKFVLHIPNSCFFTVPSADLLGSWMLLISQNEVKELTIEVPGIEISLPSYLFHSNGLQHLKLHVHRLEIHPHDFSGFSNLISLDLSVVIDDDEISNLISKCPLLETLSLSLRFLIHHLVIDAPGLHFLNACFNIVNDVDFCYLISMFGSLPKVETVILYLPRKLAMLQDAPVSLPITLHNHNSLTVLNIDISSLECIYFVLCVLKSSPNLQMLNLEILPSETSEDEAALPLQTREPQTLNSLLTVKMKGPMGSKVEFMFLKMILSCSPILKTIYLTKKVSCFSMDQFNGAEFTLMSEQCPRSSSQAQVIYSKPPGDRSIFDF